LLRSQTQVSIKETKERVNELDRSLEDNVNETASLKERLDGSNSRVVEISARLSAATCKLAQMEPVQEKQKEELICLNTRHQETKLQLNTIDERMRTATDVMQNTVNSLNKRVDRIEPDQERQRQDMLQLNKALEVVMHQTTAGQRLGEENHRKFRSMAEARERIDRKDQETFDSLNSSVAHLSLLLKETVHRVNTHASHLKIVNAPIRPGTARQCAERLDGSLPYRPSSNASTRREGSASSHLFDDVTRSTFKESRPSRPASARVGRTSDGVPQVLKQAAWAVPTLKEGRNLPEIQQPLPTKTA